MVPSNFSFLRQLTTVATLVVANVCLTLLADQASVAATATAGAGITLRRLPTDTDPDSQWFFFTPKPGVDTITWTSGPNVTDNLAHAATPAGPEAKFAGPPLAGRVFKGITDNDGPGLGGSTTKTTGTGTSGPAGGILGGWTANWTVTATGKLGGPYLDPTTSRRKQPKYESQITAKDPFVITPDDFSEHTGSFYDLYFAAGLESGSYSELGGLGLQVFYDTASESRNVLDIAISSSGVDVSNDSLAGLTMYRLATLDEGPTEIAANETSLSGIQSILMADVESDRSLDAPLFLGFVLENLPVPTLDMGDGSVAQIRVESRVADAAVGVPEPATFVLLGLAACVPCFRLRRSSRPRLLAARP